MPTANTIPRMPPVTSGAGTDTGCIANAGAAIAARTITAQDIAGRLLLRDFEKELAMKTRFLLATILSFSLSLFAAFPPPAQGSHSQYIWHRRH